MPSNVTLLHPIPRRASTPQSFAALGVPQAAGDVLDTPKKVGVGERSHAVDPLRPPSQAGRRLAQASHLAQLHSLYSQLDTAQGAKSFVALLHTLTPDDVPHLQPVTLLRALQRGLRALQIPHTGVHLTPKAIDVLAKLLALYRVGADFQEPLWHPVVGDAAILMLRDGCLCLPQFVRRLVTSPGRLHGVVQVILHHKLWPEVQRQVFKQACKALHGQHLRNASMAAVCERQFWVYVLDASAHEQFQRATKKDLGEAQAGYALHEALRLMALRHAFMAWAPHDPLCATLRALCMDPARRQQAARLLDLLRLSAQNPTPRAATTLGAPAPPPGLWALIHQNEISADRKHQISAAYLTQAYTTMPSRQREGLSAANNPHHTAINAAVALAPMLLAQSPQNRGVNLTRLRVLSTSGLALPGLAARLTHVFHALPTAAHATPWETTPWALAVQHLAWERSCARLSHASPSADEQLAWLQVAHTLVDPHVTQRWPQSCVTAFIYLTTLSDTLEHTPEGVWHGLFSVINQVQMRCTPRTGVGPFWQAFAARHGLVASDLPTPSQDIQLPHAGLAACLQTTQVYFAYRSPAALGSLLPMLEWLSPLTLTPSAQADLLVLQETFIAQDRHPEGRRAVLQALCVRAMDPKQPRMDPAVFTWVATTMLLSRPLDVPTLGVLLFGERRIWDDPNAQNPSHQKLVTLFKGGIDATRWALGCRLANTLEHLSDPAVTPAMSKAVRSVRAWEEVSAHETGYTP